nr:hypothetical protein [Tanacetum cinerariifolium]
MQTKLAQDDNLDPFTYYMGQFSGDGVGYEGGGGFIVGAGGGSPPNMVIFGSGGVGVAVVLGGDRGVLVIGDGGRPHDMVGDIVDRGSHLDDASPT